MNYSRLTGSNSSGIWETTAPTGTAAWYEVGDGGWRITVNRPAGVSGVVLLLAGPHARSWRGNGDFTGNERLYNKGLIWRVAPSVVEDLNSEALLEMLPGNAILRAFDNSRIIMALDEDPAEGANTYAVKMFNGDGIHLEVAYRSLLVGHFFPN